MLKPYLHAGLREAGCDEAGRGCLAGPVVAAAVILPPDFFHPQLNDSKKLSARVREELKEYILKHALAWSVASVDVKEIERINILRASMKAMHKALEQLSPLPEFILVDGNRFTPFKKIPHCCIVKGDATYMSVAAAGILAKTWRDEYMQKLHIQFPRYGWNENKGYATEQHRQAILQNGLTPHHRKSFCTGLMQMKLF
ncbi:MAG: ribonuclease HII [Chitinophagaceae bacterium]|nr:ribonuclease HII [Chitinophagaceae bacterium]